MQIELGRLYRFHRYSPDTFQYRDFEGALVVAERPLTAEEADLTETGPMYRVHLKDDADYFLDVFIEELHDPYEDLYTGPTYTEYDD